MLCCLQVAARLIAHVPDANLQLQGYEFCSEEIAREAFEFQRTKSVQEWDGNTQHVLFEQLPPHARRHGVVCQLHQDLPPGVHCGGH